MKTTIGYEREALERFLAKTRPGDEYCLVLFSNKVEPECDFDSDPIPSEPKRPELFLKGTRP